MTKFVNKAAVFPIIASFLLTQPADAAQRRAPKKSGKAAPATAPRAVESNKPSESRESVSAKPWNYVYVDTFAAVADYQVPWAKTHKTELALGLVSLSANEKVTAEELSATSSASIFGFAGELVKPVKSNLNAGGGFEYFSGSVRVALGESSATTTTSDTSINGFITPHITRELDVGIILKYHMDSTKSESTSNSFSYITMTPGIGVHDGKYEGSLSYTPGVKTKGQSSGGNSDDDSSAPEKETSSDLVLTGRYLIAQPIYLGGGFKTETETNEKATAFLFEGGLVAQDYHISAGLSLKSSTRTSPLTNNTSTKSTTTFNFEGVVVNAQKLPKFSAALTYGTSSGKSDTTTTSGSSLGIAGGGYIHF